MAESIKGPGYGTSTKRAIDKHFDGHDRVIVVTDEQPGYSYWGGGDVFSNIPENVPTSPGTSQGAVPVHSEIKVNRYTFGGLTDKGFQMDPASGGRTQSGLAVGE